MSILTYQKTHQTASVIGSKTEGKIDR